LKVLELKVLELKVLVEFVPMWEKWGFDFDVDVDAGRRLGR
jgi:hypothetical protein